MSKTESDATKFVNYVFDTAHQKAYLENTKQSLTVTMDSSDYDIESSKNINPSFVITKDDMRKHTHRKTIRKGFSTIVANKLNEQNIMATVDNDNNIHCTCNFVKQEDNSFASLAELEEANVNDAKDLYDD